MNIELKFNRGDKVKHLYEGWEGTITSYYVPSDGMIMYGCAVPRIEQGYSGETTDVVTDEDSLILIEACKEDNPLYSKFNTNLKFEPGDRVESIINPKLRTGIITGVNCFFNNCIYYFIETERLNKDGKVITDKISENLLRKVDESVSDKKIKEEIQKNKSSSNKRTGGPSFIMDRNRF